MGTPARDTHERVFFAGTTSRTVNPMFTRALIVPSLYATPDDHWYPNLRERLAAQGFTDVRTSTPPSGEPELADWLASIDEVSAGLREFGEDTVVIGHSLGAVAALAYLSARADLIRIGRFVGVAGFAEPLPDLPTTKAFVEAVDAGRIRTLVGDRQMVLAEDDYAVPPELTERAAADIDAIVHRVDHGGHFLARDGWEHAGPIGDLAG